MEKVFVYGTLKRGHGNHFLLENSKYLGSGITDNKYVMYTSAIPYVSKQLNLTTILGELYEVDELTLNDLDMLEGHPTWYKREIVSISYICNKGKVRKVKAWLYFNEQIPGNAEVSTTGVYSFKNLTVEYKSLLS